MAFEIKSWLDSHVVPLLAGSPPLKLYSFIWKDADGAEQPTDVLVWLHAGDKLVELDKEPCTCEAIIRAMSVTPEDAKGDCPRHQYEAMQPPICFDPLAWPQAAKRLLDNEGFRFDFLREQLAVVLEGGTISVFGGDGAPLFNEQGMASCRLFRKEDDGINLIVQLGCQYPVGVDAAAATKVFYAQFEGSPLTVIQRYGALFGQA
jgi:hypothetical protein